MARRSVRKSARPGGWVSGISVGEPEIQPAAVWIWGGWRGDHGQGVLVHRRGTHEAGWSVADRVAGFDFSNGVGGFFRGFQPNRSAERVFSRKHADGAAGLQPEREHEVVRAAQL